MVLRAFVPGAETRRGHRRRRARRSHGCNRAAPTGFFEALVPGRSARVAYRLHAHNAGGALGRFAIPMRFGPVLGPLDDYLLVEGTHRRLYERLGAHPMTP